MTTYLLRCKYTTAGYQGMLSNPADRGEAIKPLLGALGYKLLNFWFSPPTAEAYIMMEGGDDMAKLATAGMIVLGSGSISDVQTTLLIDSKTMLESMKAAGTITGAYKPPAATS